MATPTTRVSEMLRGLRHFYAPPRPFLASLARPGSSHVPVCRDNTEMSESVLTESTTPPPVWKTRAAHITRSLVNFAWVCVVYLASELVIWGLSRALAPAHLEFFSSICGMALTFALMAALCACFPNMDNLYRHHVKPKIDFLNSHLGLGFPIPLVMLNKTEILPACEIGRIIANFLLTNIASWLFVFALSFLVMTTAAGTSYQPSQASCNSSTTNRSSTQEDDAIWSSESVLDEALDYPNTDCEKSIRNEMVSIDQSSELSHKPPRTALKPTFSSPLWNIYTSCFNLLFSFVSIFLIGIPIAATTREERILDGCVLWFVWVLSITLQRGAKSSNYGSLSPELKNAVVTLMNPVLMATLLMTAYVRAKAAAHNTETLSGILNTFSSGTPLYALWTSGATNTPLPRGAAHWFGAGDAALSILECGILIWGFKLYECQAQLLSTAGVLTVIVSIVSAAANVFLCVLSGRATGLRSEEALAFAARSTTLALAKPAVEAVGGSLGANAALVVSNGILGQLVYPFVLDRLGTGLSDGEVKENVPASDVAEPTPGEEESSETGDSASTIAAGIAIGINGAAMGVSYLYETKSRSAPYAALAMTVFGIMTVILTTVEPFQSVVIELASR